MEVAQTSPYSHGLWNIKQNWRLYHRAGKADQVRPNRRSVTSHNVAGNTREKQQGSYSGSEVKGGDGLQN